ncbi:hypothetical protein GCM10027294_53950 [Marinactinospora endophytica]
MAAGHDLGGRRGGTDLLPQTERVLLKPLHPRDHRQPGALPPGEAFRAGVSPGSLYQFFRNKDEILTALVPRYTERSAAFWGAQLNEEVARLPLDELLDRVIGAMAAFKAERPAFWVLFHGSATSARLAEVAAQVHEGIAEGLCELFRVRAPDLARERLDMLARVCIATTRGLFPLVMAAEPEQRKRLLAELKGVLLGYLGPVLGCGPIPRG